MIRLCMKRRRTFFVYISNLFGVTHHQHNIPNFFANIKKNIKKKKKKELYNRPLKNTKNINKM